MRLDRLLQYLGEPPRVEVDRAPGEEHADAVTGTAGPVDPQPGRQRQASSGAGNGHAGRSAVAPQGRRRAIALAIGCLSAVACCYLFKGLFGRTRPWVLHNGLYHFLGPAYGFGHGASYQSFPSAHTSGAFALAAGLSWFYPRGRGLFYFMGLVVAWQRVMRHAHFPSDVIAGALLAVTVVRTVLWLGWPGKLIALFPQNWQAWIFTDNEAVAATKA